MNSFFRISLMGCLLSLSACSCRHPASRRTVLYAVVDTTWQQPMEYSVQSGTLFPYTKFVGHSPLEKAGEIRDGRCVIAFETDRPVTVSIMPVRDSTAKIFFSGSFVVHPGDSLEVRSVADPRFAPGMAVKPQLVETAYRDNAFEESFQAAFPYRSQPVFADGDALAYKRDVEAYHARKCAFLDSCSRVMPLSEFKIRRARAAYELARYNTLSDLVQRHPELDLPADYLGEERLPDEGFGTAVYVSALLNKYVRNVSSEPENHYAEIERGIRRAPRRLRDYLTALQIGYFAERRLPSYAEAFEASVARAERTIRDTALLGYIARAKTFYADRCVVLPDSVLTGTRVQGLDRAETTLGELLARYDGRPLYIDCWASWCSGCIFDMQRSEQARAWLGEQGVVCLCLSFDAQFDDWTAACGRYGVHGDSYRCCGEFGSPLARLLKVKTIPRYLLFDARHTIVNSDAPRPVEHELPELKRFVGLFSAQ